MKRIVSVIGAGNAGSDLLDFAYHLGKGLAQMDVVVVTGGLGGIMEAVSRGVKDGGGLAVGILPTYRHSDANPHVDIPIPTGLGHARNVAVAASGQVVIAIGGAYGTLSEIAIALKLGRPVIGYRTWSIEGIQQVCTPEEALEKIRALID